MTEAVQVEKVEANVDAAQNQQNNDKPVEQVKQADVALKQDTQQQDKKVEPSWRDDWRDTMLKELGMENDSSAKNIAARYASPSATFKALIEAQKKISSGGLKTPAPKDNPEALSRWRQENGVPEKPEEYKLELSDGLIVGERDKPALNEFLKAAHESNMPTEFVNKVADWYFHHQESQLAEFAKNDEMSSRETKQSLNQEWGGAYEQNLNEVANHLKMQFGEEMAESLQYARLPDGRLLGNSPEFIKAMLQNSRELNPGATLVPGSGNTASSIDSELQNIQNIMRDTPEKYWGDPLMQKKFGDLLAAKEKISKRA